MSPLDHFSRFLKSLSELYPEPHPPTPASRRQTAIDKKRLEANPANDSFYLEMRVGAFPHIPWSANTQALLGCKQLTMESFMERLHPDYAGIFLDFAVGVYTLLPKYRDIIWQQPMAYNIMVPLCDKEGRYFWFKQYAQPSGLAENGQLTHHLNAYRLISDFQGTVMLSRPYVLFQADAVPGVQQELQQFVAKTMLEQMFELELDRGRDLGQTHKRILFAWWKAYADPASGQTNHSMVAELLNLRVSTTRRHAQTILEAARIIFPIYPIRDMNDFAQLLVSLFGAEGHQLSGEMNGPS